MRKTTKTKMSRTLGILMLTLMAFSLAGTGIPVVNADAVDLFEVYSQLPNYSHGQYNERSLRVEVIDYDLDGNLDFVVANIFGFNVFYRGNGDGTFVQETPLPYGSARALRFADYDNDGDPDIAEASTDGRKSRIWKNDGSGNFILVHEWRGPYNRDITVVDWGDADNDGDLDIAVGVSPPPWGLENELVINEGGDTFTHILQFGDAGVNDFEWGDYDNDGDMDLAVGRILFPGVATENYYYENDPVGTFTGTPAFDMGATIDMESADYDLDGDLDLAVANYQGSSYLYINEGDGIFIESTPFVSDIHKLDWGDYNNDGYPDLLAMKSDKVYFYTNNGDGTFSETDLGFPATATQAGADVAWGDFNGDGRLDFVLVTYDRPPFYPIDGAFVYLQKPLTATIDNYIQELPSVEFTKPEEDVADIKDDFADKFDDVEENIGEGDYQRAIEHLEEIKDFVYVQIKDPEKQEIIIGMVDALIAYLETP